MDKNDVPLTLGAAYFANENDFAQYQVTLPMEEKEVSLLTSMQNSLLD